METAAGLAPREGVERYYVSVIGVERLYQRNRDVSKVSRSSGGNDRVYIQCLDSDSVGHDIGRQEHHPRLAWRLYVLMENGSEKRLSTSHPPFFLKKNGKYNIRMTALFPPARPPMPRLLPTWHDSPAWMITFWKSE